MTCATCFVSSHNCSMLFIGYLLSIGFPDSNYFLIAVVACIVTGLVSGLR